MNTTQENATIDMANVDARLHDAIEYCKSLEFLSEIKLDKEKVIVTYVRDKQAKLIVEIEQYPGQRNVISGDNWCDGEFTIMCFNGKRSYVERNSLLRTVNMCKNFTVYRPFISIKMAHKLFCNTSAITPKQKRTKPEPFGFQPPHKHESLFMIDSAIVCIHDIKPVSFNGEKFSPITDQHDIWFAIAIDIIARKTKYVDQVIRRCTIIFNGVDKFFPINSDAFFNRGRGMAMSKFSNEYIKPEQFTTVDQNILVSVVQAYLLTVS